MNLGADWIIVLLIVYTPLILLKYTTMKEGKDWLPQVALIISIAAIFAATNGIGDYLLIVLYDLLWTGSIWFNLFLSKKQKLGALDGFLIIKGTKELFKKMKKFYSGVFLTLLLIFAVSPAYATNIQIKVDDIAIKSDVAPQNVNNRIMVPLRMISENLGATVDWSDSEATLSKSDMQIMLELNNATAVKNGETVLLDVKPYLKNNRVMVPLRFIAETFGCDVNYENSTVTVAAQPLLINGVKVQATQYEYHMTMGGVVQQIKGNAYNKAFYDLFLSNKGSLVEAPASYSWQPHIDTPGAYYKIGQYDFLDQKGNSIQCFDVYGLINAHPTEILAGFPEVLLHDATLDQWYLFSDTAIQSISNLVGTATNNGFLTVISNTVV